jgi:AAA15 family ATPase/GTPase
MKLIAFRIQNFKSIVDTGWVNLSKDGLSCLIGQNESGKSSVLAALHSYGNEVVQDDFVRNDMTDPSITCRFELDKNQVNKILSPFSKAGGFPILVSIFEELNNVITVKAYPDAGKLLLDNFDYDEALENFLLNQPKLPKDIVSDPKLSVEERKSVVDRYGLNWHSFRDIWRKYQPSFILFNDEANLLPNEISIADLVNDEEVEGKVAAQNLLSVANIDVERLSNGSIGAVKKYMSVSNRNVSTRFQDFWTQKIGKDSKIEVEIELKNRDANHKEAGEPFLQFWIKDGEHILHPKQRSKGVRWFISFYLSLKADAIKKKDAKSIFLIDEPGANLHARAQEDVLKVFEDIRQSNQLIYTTHSQHLIEFNNLYRLLAVQRRDDSDENSDTIIIPAYHLGSASTNTLAPILEHMGINFSNQDVIARSNNILLEEVSAMYYFQAFSILTNLKQYNYLPSTGVSNVEQLALLFLGWGLGFSIVFDDDSAGRRAYQNIVKSVYSGNEDEARKHIYKLKKCDGVEDIFNREDFFKFIIKKPIDSANLDKPNSEIAKILKISKPIAALDFFIEVKEGQIQFADLSNESQERIKDLFNNIERITSNQSS